MGGWRIYADDDGLCRLKYFMALILLCPKTGRPDKRSAIRQHDSEICWRFKRHTAAENRVGDGQHFRMQLQTRGHRQRFGCGIKPVA